VKALLGSLCSFLNGGTPNRAVDRYYTGAIPWITGADITGPIVTSARSFITEEAIRESATNRVPAGTVLLVTRTSVGKVAVAGMPLCFSQDITALTPDAKRLDAQYLVHFLRLQKPYFERIARGATIKGVTREAVENIATPLPPLSEQRRIAEVLDRAEALRAKRRAALAQLDILTQSIFFDMFGDPATNPKRMRKELLGKLLELKSGKFLPATEMATGDFPVYGGNGISGFHDRFMFAERRIVVGRVGAYCGCVHVSQPRSWITDNALYVSEQSDELVFDYLAHALTHVQLNRFASHFGQPLVSGSRIYPVEILVPPKPLQEKFVEVVLNAESIKADCQSSLDKFAILFESLQQDAFQVGL
jgi:type I restriction enzyme S subunit